MCVSTTIFGLISSATRPPTSSARTVTRWTSVRQLELGAVAPVGADRDVAPAHFHACVAIGLPRDHHFRAERSLLANRPSRSARPAAAPDLRACAGARRANWPERMTTSLPRADRMTSPRRVATASPSRPRVGDEARAAGARDAALPCPSSMRLEARVGSSRTSASIDRRPSWKRLSSRRSSSTRASVARRACTVEPSAASSSASAVVVGTDAVVRARVLPGARRAPAPSAPAPSTPPRTAAGSEVSGAANRRALADALRDERRTANRRATAPARAPRPAPRGRGREPRRSAGALRGTSSLTSRQVYGEGRRHDPVRFGPRCGRRARSTMR